VSIYSATVSNTSISSTANDIMTIVPAASTIIQIVEFTVAGCGTASSAAQINIYNITTAGTTGGGAITPSKFNPAYAPASGSTVSTTWSTQPTVGVIIVPLAVNGNGGIYRWVARPGEELYAIGGIAAALGFSIRASLAPSTNFTVSVVWVESPF
jgi:hypothetical protein